MSEKLGLYVHIPFCKSKCAYCDFYSLTGCTDYERYTDALILHMQDYADAVKDRITDTVYIGGGTPTTLPKKCMLDLLYGIKKNFVLDKDCEFTTEANPATVSTDMLRAYAKNGINRVSFGMQSANEGELKALGRIHSFGDFKKSYKSARRAGIDNISVDIMYGIPEQTRESLMHTLSETVAMGPEHISLYGLKIEENTKFGRMKDSLVLPDEDTEYAMYCDSIELLEKNGYHQYEISNFAKKGYECRHNLKYWNCEEYLGLGPAAYSYFNNTRFSFKKDIGLYVNALEHRYSELEITDENETISQSERMGEYIMLGLRLKKGINTVKFREKFSKDFEKMYEKELPLYVEGGFMEKKGSSYAFTVKGMYVSNYILSTLLEFEEQN